MGGSSKTAKASERVCFPAELIAEAEGFCADDISYFPDNSQAISVFSDMLTQWRTGMNGPTGFDYTALPVVLKIRGIKRKTWNDIFECLKIMEQAALKTMRMDVK